MDPKDIALGFAVLFVSGGGVYVAVTIARAAVARWLPPAGADASEISHLREDVQRLSGDLSDVHQAMSELQERVDFAERLLARQPEAERLKGGS